MKRELRVIHALQYVLAAVGAWIIINWIGLFDDKLFSLSPDIAGLLFSLLIVAVAVTSCIEFRIGRTLHFWEQNIGDARKQYGTHFIQIRFHDFAKSYKSSPENWKLYYGFAVYREKTLDETAVYFGEYDDADCRLYRTLYFEEMEQKKKQELLEQERKEKEENREREQFKKELLEKIH